MKKRNNLILLFSFFAIVLFLTSCAPVNTKQTTKEIPKSTEDRMYYKNYPNRLNPDGYSYTAVRKAEYDGHSYIIFGNGESRCIVHDPDCKCQKNKDSMFDW